MTDGGRRGVALAAGFGLAKAVTSNAYVTAFATDARSSMGLVSSTSFTLTTNVLSALAALAVVVLAVRGGWGVQGAGPAGTRTVRSPLVACAPVGCAVLACGYVLGAAGVFASLPPQVGSLADGALYAVGMTLVTVAWVAPFVAEPEQRFAINALIGGYLVQAAAYFCLSFLGGWPLTLTCAALLAASLALLVGVTRAQAAGGPSAANPGAASSRGALREALSVLTSPLTCVFILTAVVGLLHTSVIGSALEPVVGAVPTAEALAVATILCALVVRAGRRVPDTTSVYRALFPVMLVALSLLPFVSEALGAVSGMVMVVCYDMVGIMCVLLLVEVARDHPQAPSAALVGVYLAGTQVFLVAGLALGLALNHLGAGAPTASYVTVLMLACIYLLALVLMVLLRRRRAPSAEGGARQEPPALTRDEELAEQREVRGRVASQVEAFARERGLTPREAQVLVRLARGRSAAALAADLGIAENTAWAHIKRVYAKLGVHGKQELIDLVEREVLAGGREG